MKKRMLMMSISLLVFVAALGTVKYMQIRAAIAQGASFRMPPESVTTIVADETQWEDDMGAIGTVTPVQGVMLSADLPGVVQSIAVDSGKRVHEGEVLVRLDTRQEQAQLAAATAKAKLARLNRERTGELLKKGVTSQAEYDRMEAEAEEARAQVEEITATIERKTIRAPFAGILGIRKVNVGQFLNGGAPVVPLQALDPVYVDFTVPQQSVSVLHLRDTVHVALSHGSPVVASGTITAINPVVDQQTRNVQVQVTLHNADGKLLPGMFVEVRAVTGVQDSVVALPASAISYAPYGDSVFIVEDVKGPNGDTYRGVRQQFVKLGASRGDQIAVIDGVKAGEEVVTSGVFKLRGGAAVQVHNEVQPSNNPAPKPEDS